VGTTPKVQVSPPRHPDGRGRASFRAVIQENLLAHFAMMRSPFHQSASRSIHLKGCGRCGPICPSRKTNFILGVTHCGELTVHTWAGWGLGRTPPLRRKNLGNGVFQSATGNWYNGHDLGRERRTGPNPGMDKATQAAKEAAPWQFPRVWRV